ncbi:MAG: VOC family protein [Actinobacteria bacterium]|nr:VOC family protein [Actinomycetota bacterium]MBO0835694.1 VOC family protein [Actinomycetota bacterium]
MTTQQAERRLGHVTRVGHTGITVSDLDRASGYFRDALGLEVSAPIPCSGELFEQVTGVPGCVIDICYVTAPGHTIELLCYSSPAGKVSSGLRPCDNGHLHLCFEVDDIEAVIEAGRSYDFEPVNPVQVVREGTRAGTKVIYTRGPDNLIVELMELPSK